jgi:hypothetical protein
MGAMEDMRRRGSRSLALWMLAFSTLGLAVLFRFHVGLIFVSYALILIYLRIFPAVIGSVLGGVFTLGAQALVDVMSGKAPLATLFIYLSENEGGGAKYGVSPWYNPWLFILGLSLAPFSFVLWGSMRSLWRRHWPVIIPFLIFIAAHSLVAHKEERFLYPVIALELWLLAHLWSANTLRWPARRIFAPVFLFVSLLALPAVCFINTQEGEIEPPAKIESRYGGDVVYLDHESLFGRSRFKFYFLRPPSVLEAVPREDFSANKVDRSFSENPHAKAVVMLTSEPEVQSQLIAMAGVSTVEGRCLEVESSGSLIDQLLYAMNPKHNQRRRPTWYLICERGVHV